MAAEEKARENREKASGTSSGLAHDVMYCLLLSDCGALSPHHGDIGPQEQRSSLMAEQMRMIAHRQVLPAPERQLGYMPANDTLSSGCTLKYIKTV